MVNTLGMAQQKNPADTEEFRSLLSAAMERQGTNPAALYNRVVMQTGNRVTTSSQHIRDMATGKVNPHVANLNVLAALLRVLDLSDDGLGPVVADRIELLLATVGAGPDSGGDLRIAKSRCTAQASDELATVTPLRWTQPQLQEAA